MANVLVTGATGFVGRHLAPALVDEGHMVRCLVRESSDRSVLPEEAVEFAVGDVTRPEGLAAACDGCDAIVHLVGVIVEVRGATFERVHVAGTRNVLEAGKASGVERVIFLSGIGSGPHAAARYHRTKWQAEELVRQSGVNWTVIRSSVIVGEGDGFTRSILGLLRKGPFIPIAGSGQTKLQPIYIADLCRCIAVECRVGQASRPERSRRGVECRVGQASRLSMPRSADPQSLGRTYEVGGPEQLTFEQMVDEVARLKGVRKRKLHIPVGAVRIIAALQERFSRRPEITRDQLKMMEADNVCAPDALRKLFGFPGTPYRQALRTFLKARR